ncbi:MAG: RtcB family protein [Clostridia bacterium]|nr:RtcB family protein [Clostridia bacterium]
MITVSGSYNTAKCYCKSLQEDAELQILALCEEEAFRESVIRIMPDVHAGKGCTIGTSMTLTDKVVPAMVGVDIGCGMYTVKLPGRALNFKRLDQVIRERIPAGTRIRKTPHPMAAEVRLEELRCIRHVNVGRALRSLGTLGGGNHFIELDRNRRGELYLVIHSGSRNLGVEVAEFYQSQGAPWMPPELAYLEGAMFENYLYDMKRVQAFAALNRRIMAAEILEGMGLTARDCFETIHNYIDTDAMLLRKGAVSAKAGEKLLIPINMRDGSLVCIGKGNPDWNCSAPHGAGRLLSRREAREQLTVEEYRNEMKGVFSSCVDADTLDESPMAYKSMAEILEQITPTVEVVERISPVYNFKAGAR